MLEKLEKTNDGSVNVQPLIICENLRNLRIINKLTLRELESKTGISNSELSLLEKNNRKNPQINTLNALAKFYKISLDDLVNKKLEINFTYGWESI